MGKGEVWDLVMPAHYLDLISNQSDIHYIRNKAVTGGDQGNALDLPGGRRSLPG
jgi:hypothetical protein